MNKINSFAIYREYWELITLLNEKEQSNVLMAVFKYMFEDEEIKLSEREKKVFVNLKRPLDKSKNKANNARTRQNQKEIKSKSNENQNTFKEEAHQDVNVIVNDNVYVNNIYSYLEDNFGRTLSSIEYEEVSSWKDNELTRYAIKQAVLNGKYNIKYISAILNSFKKNNITSVQQAQQESTRFKNGNVPEWFGKEIKQKEISDERKAKAEAIRNGTYKP